MSESTWSFKVTHIFSLVDAFKNLEYLLDPTLEPEATIPPGNGVIVPGTWEIAFTANWAAFTPAITSLAKMKKFPPATPSL